MSNQEDGTSVGHRPRTVAPAGGPPTPKPMPHRDSQAVFEEKEKKTQSLLSFKRGELIPLKGGWFKVAGINGRKLQLELVDVTNNARRQIMPKVRSGAKRRK